MVFEQRREEIKYFQRYFETNKTNMKNPVFRHQIYCACGNKKAAYQISHLLENGNRINDPTKMANIFNNYFVNVGSNILANQFLELESPLLIT